MLKLTAYKMSHKNKNRAIASQVGAVAENHALAASEAEAASSENISAPAKEKKVTSSTDKVAYFAPLIESGKYTAKELTAMALAEGRFPKLTESTIRTFLTDSKNPKYNKFDRLVVKTEDGKLTFQAPAGE